jgi:ribosomal protein S18 acetylase RimI-like enzyme
MAVGKSAASTPEDFRRHADAYSALIAWDETVPIGLCLYFPSFSSWRGRTGVYIQDLYVVASARGTALARTLLAEAARRTNAAYLRLSVDRGNAAAQRFYAREGLAPADEERIYVIEGGALARLTGD